MKLFMTGCFIFLTLLTSIAQDNPEADKNAILKKITQEFWFSKGNNEHPVIIKQTIKKAYSCNSYRSEIPVVEFYNDTITIDGVNVWIDSKRTSYIHPKFEYYNIDGTFYSDAHVCYFTLPVTKKDAISEVEIKKTYLDPKYFTSVFLMEDLSIEEGDVIIHVPSWMNTEIKEFNFKNFHITKSKTNQGDETTYSYHIQNIPAIYTQKNSPGITYFAPHLLIWNKSATNDNGSFTYFKNLKDQYAWYKKLLSQIGNNNQTVKSKAEEITKGLTTDEDRVKAIYLWVQNNIRYVAFENGIAGFRPEKAQDVLYKKYGDCKGMANLLTQMLRSINLDARMCWLGTNHIAYDYSIPSLADDNHMICAWMNKGKPVFLDGTEKYIGYGEIAERIQGRPILIENDNQYILEKVPQKDYTQNTATEIRKLIIDGENVKGHIIQTWKGENKEWLLDDLNSLKQDKQEVALKQFLKDGKQNIDVDNLKIINLSDQNQDLKVEYDILWKNALSSFDKETYLEIDNRHFFESAKIDTTNRTLPYWLSFKHHFIIEIELPVPKDKSVTTMPKALSIKKANYNFSASYTIVSSLLKYKCEISVNNAVIAPENFNEWNNDINQLSEFYNQQIVLTSK